VKTVSPEHMDASPDAPPRRKRRSRPLTADRLRNIALFYLERYGGSSARLKRVLTRRLERDARLHGPNPDVDAGTVAALVRRFLEAGLVDDAAWARGRAAALHRRGRPLADIRQALAADETAPDDISAALDSLAPDAAAADLAAALVYARRRRLGPFRPPVDREARYRQDLAALARRGFSYAIASQVMAAPGPENFPPLPDSPNRLPPQREEQYDE